MSKVMSVGEEKVMKSGWEKVIVVNDEMMEIMKEKCEWWMEIVDEKEDRIGSKCEMVRMRIGEYIVMGVECKGGWRVSGVKRW